MATLNQVRQAMHAQPFRPFLLQLANGKSYEVKHPDFLAIPPTPRGREVVFWVDDEMHLIDLGLILEVVMSTEAGAAPVRTEDNGE
jgi:hypothetical protein